MAQETKVKSLVESYQRLKKWYLSNPGNGVVPSPTLWWVAIEKGALGSPSTKVANFTFFFLWIELPWPIRWTPSCDIRKHWTAVSTLLGHISSVYHDLPPLEIKPSTTECRAKTLPLTQDPTSHTSDPKSTSYGKCVTN